MHQHTFQTTEEPEKNKKAVGGGVQPKNMLLMTAPFLSQKDQLVSLRALDKQS